jgi:GNAT superfamily N-acetyltransferase
MVKSPFQIRNATEHDEQAAYRLIVALGYPDLPLEGFAQIFREVLESQSYQVFIASDAAGRALGLMTISHRPQMRLAGAILCIDELTVSPEARGTGVGRALLQEARKVARKQKARRIELHTSRARESYHRNFYRKNGFTEADSALMRLDIPSS